MKRIAGVVIAAMIIGLLGNFAGAEEMESAPPVVEASAVPSASATPTATASRMEGEYEEIRGKSYESAVQRVSALGLMTGYEDGSFGAEKNITRAEFAAILIRASNLESVANMETGPSQYSDVPSEHWASGAISLATRLGFVNGMGDGKFEPESEITYEQAAKTFVCILGYSVMVKQQPGASWYADYMRVASQIGILKSVQGAQVGQPLTRAQAAVMLDNTINTDIMTMAEGDSYQIERGSTLLNNLLDNGDSLKGVVEANSDTSLTGTSSLVKEEVIIGGYRYNVGTTNAADYLGQYVQFFVKDEDGTATIQGIFPVKNRNEMLEVDGRDIISITNNKLTYATEENDFNEETESLSDSLAVIYNGKAYPGYSEQVLMSPAAKLKLIDNSGDGVYDVAMVRENTIAKVERVNIYDSMLYLQSNLESGINSIDFKPKKSRITIKDQKGSELALEDLSEEDTILEICASRDAMLVDIIRLDDVVTGTVSSIDGANGRITVDDVEYDLYEGRGGYLVDIGKLSIGTMYGFTVDSENRIVDADEDKLSGNLQYGLIYRKNEKASGIQSDLEVKVVSGTTIEQVKENDVYYIKSKDQQEVRRLTCADRVRMTDGKRTWVVKDAAELSANLNELEVVQYALNKDGEINRIIKCQEAGDLGDRTLNAKEMILGGTTRGAFGMDEDTVVFFLPKGDVEEDFLSEMKYKDGIYESQGYDLAEDEPVAGAVVFQTDINSDDEVYFNDTVPFAIAQAVTKGIDENGEEYYRITGYEKGKPFDLKTSPSASAANDEIAKLDCGSVFRMGRNFEGKITTVQSVKTGYNVNSPEHLTPDSRFYDRTEERGGRQIYGMATSTTYKTLGDYSTSYENTLSVSVNADGTEAETHSLIYNEQDAPYYYIYDYKKGKVMPADFKDIIPAESTDTESASRVLLYMINSVVKVVVIVK